MLKFMLLPLILAAASIVLIAVFAKKGNIVSSMAKNVQSQKSSRWPLIFFVLVVCGGMWRLHEASDPVQTMMTLLWFIIALMIVFSWISLCAATEVVTTAAPLAAEIGEQMTDGQKRSLLRHGLRWFDRFRKW